MGDVAQVVVGLVLIVVLGLLAVLLFAFGRPATQATVDAFGESLGRRARVAQRLPYYGPLRRLGIVGLLLAALMPAAGFKGQPDTTAHTWHVLLTLCAAFGLASGVLLGLWWILAGRRAAQVKANGGVTFDPTPRPQPLKPVD